MKKPSRTEKLEHLRKALTYVKSFRTAVDAGAHIGLWTEIMAKQFSRVLAFEPLESNVRSLENLAEELINIEVYPWALGEDSVERAYLVCTPKDDNAGHVHSKHFVVKTPNDAWRRHLPTKIDKIDNYNIKDLDFLKTDCEGMDMFVLEGGIKTIKRCLPVIIVESHPKFEVRYGLQPGAPVKFLESLGYRLVETMWKDFLLLPPNAVQSKTPA